MKRPADRVSTAALLRLLRRDDPEQVAAAAIVLGALRPVAPEVLPALRRRLESAPSHLKPYLLDAVASLPGRESLALLLPYLKANGSLREQAVNLVAARGSTALPYLTKSLRACTPADDSRTLLRALRAVPGARALDALLDHLPRADFDQAKQICSALRERIDGLDAAGRRQVVARLQEHLESDACSTNPTAEIAVLKAIATAGDARPLRLVLRRAEPGRLSAVRNQALETLESLPLTTTRSRAIATALLPLLDGEDGPTTKVLVLRVLRRCSPSPIPLERWLELSRSDSVAIARLALVELRRFPKERVIDTLLEALRRPSADVQTAAASVLGELPEALDDLLAAHENPDFAPRKETLRAILAARSESLPEARFRRTAEAMIATAQDDATLESRLRVLATLDRSGLNQVVEAEARARLDSGDPKGAVRLLEPLVRGRFATPGGRYLLALGHLLVREPGSGQNDGHFDRALHLLGPLARLPDWDLKAPLCAEPRLDPARALELADALAARKGPERSLGEALRDLATPRMGGQWTGMVRIADDFDAPLPAGSRGPE